MGCELTAEEVAYIDRTIADLKDENARLRSCLSDDAENARMIMAENAKLREQIHWLKKGDILHVLTDQEFAEQQKHEREMQASIKALDDENAKLRELVRTFYHCTTSGECDECPINGGGPVHLMPDTICDTIHDRMRELGVDA